MMTPFFEKLFEFIAENEERSRATVLLATVVFGIIFGFATTALILGR